MSKITMAERLRREQELTRVTDKIKHLEEALQTVRELRDIEHRQVQAQQVELSKATEKYMRMEREVIWLKQIIEQLAKPRN